jgi:hypothetical protein
VAGPPAEGPEGEGEVTIASTVSSKISYQGVLKKNGQPVTGSKDMTFRFYSDDACTTQVGSDITKPGVEVTDGLFSVDLDVTHGHFNGQGLWLEVEVGGTKIGCEEILPVPYALSLRPGADIIGSIDGDSVLEARNESTFGVTSGVYGLSSSFSGMGVFGIATADSGPTYGVYGTSDSTSGRGVYGYATADSGTTYGVYGISNSPDGYGVYGTAPTTGTVGIATAASGETYGVYGESESPSGYGGYFKSSGGTALYAAGDARITGDLTVDGSLIGGEHTHSTLPIAYGFVRSDGSLASGTQNVSSAWNTTLERYEITISGYNYYYTSYSTVVTLGGTCSQPCAVRTGSVGGKLLVYIYDKNGTNVQCHFQFVTFKP